MSELEARDSTQALHINKPSWLKTKIPTGDTFFDIKRDLRSKNLFTVCEEAKCPNISECWATNTATFMVLGDTCTRACRFCNVKTGNPQGWLDNTEPEKTAESVRMMKLKYAVLTMVDRDDLEDGGSAHVKKVFEAIREKSPTTLLEFLGGDFQAKDASLVTILEAKPEVYAHNIETVRRLTPRVRDARASYDQSLKVLKRVKELTTYELFTKSAIMLGLGETMDEVVTALKDLRAHDVDFITIGQYMRPSKRHLSIKEFVPPEQFDELAVIAKELGFMSVASGPLVRSSYKASEFYNKAMLLREELRR
ncbi:MAG: lipoyl synthase [Proteobacteria bacterium]|nr:MAG: lipoyl synthase [Pseudomonadota bacterium]